ISAILVIVAVFMWVPADWAGITSIGGLDATTLDIGISPRIYVIGAVFIGIILAAVIQQLTAYFTETNRRPVDDVAKTSLTGPATVILSGISVGLESAVYSALLIALAVYGAFLLGGGSVLLALFAIALAGTGLLTTVGVIVSMDTFGPVSDNAQGIAEMSGDVHGEGAAVLTRLDAVGNSTKAITKGIAIATAVLAATALFGSFRDAVVAAFAAADVDLEATTGDIYNLLQFEGVLDVANPSNLVGLIIGSAVVFLFSGLAINAVSRAAGAVIFEVRRQFREIPGIMDGSAKPEYGKVVDIVTRDSLRELITPGLLAVLTPIAVGFGLGVGALGAYLAGTIATGVLMAVFLSNSGGAWDNAKKFVEDGNFGGKGSEAHAATVIGDTVGDPFKDTAGPAINPLIKVMNLVALLIAPAVVSLSIGTAANPVLRWVIAVGAALIVVVAVIISKRRPIAVGDVPATK
ncbi:MAG: sodium/proton-translocating pyrophosphatase, partial [Actinomycetales bacterium]